MLHYIFLILHQEMLLVNIETVQIAQKTVISILAYFIQEDYLNK